MKRCWEQVCTQVAGAVPDLKGDAYSVSEGGMRVPLIVRWPGKVKAGSSCSEMVTLMDVLPTLASLNGVPLAKERKIDGHDISALLFSEAGSRSPYKVFYYYYVNQLQAVRSNEWKLYLPLEKCLTALGRKTFKAEGRLYNLNQDPIENNNLFSTSPDVVKRLLAYAEDARRDLGEFDQRGANVRPIGVMRKATPRLLKED